MSSSAFTPSTTTVTNNVPVNVPVVTAWEDVSSPAIPTGLGSGSGTWAYYKTRRVGGNLEILARFNKDATAGTGSTNVSFSLPYSNITIDSSVNTIGYATSFFVGGVAGFRTLTAARGTSTTFVFDKDLGADAVKGSDIVGGAQLRFFVSLPIAEWAGSGTTTLATRAVEEYAFNTSTATAANDTTSFGYGSSGAQIQNITASLTRRVRFQTPIQATDKFCLEVSINRINWQDVSYRFGDNSTSDIVQLTRQLTATYGVGYIVPVNSTDIDVTFGQYAEPASAAYGSAGRAWSAGAGSWYWRVRKVSSGAQVGYPVSARNIVGDTSGSVVPVGMLGEILTFTARGGLVTTGGWRIPDTSPLVTLTAGSWMIYGRLLNTVGIAAGTTSMTGAISNSSVAGTGVGVPAVYGRLDNAFVAAGSGLEAPLSVNYVTVAQGSTLPLYAQFISSGANNTLSISGYAVRIS